MNPEKNQPNYLSNALKKGVERLVPFASHLFSFLRLNTEKTRHQFSEIFAITSDQVREKAEETKRAVKLRMTMLEIEHHLNRLYPQIGKIACDLAEQGKKNPLNNAELKQKIELADEYRERLKELKNEQTSLHQKQRPRD